VKNMAWQALLKLQIAFLQGHARSDNMLVGRYKQWLGMLTQGYEEANELWQNAKKIKNLDEMLKLLAKYL
ncbi:MAG: tRNA dihydrouridine(16) synthase DusC, partial [Moraxella sp.]|nr:tRNA dihydrouridine(16) synthase DusC [Moraxella sp.]